MAWRMHYDRRTQNRMNQEFESTYALIVRSEEKSRTVLETVLYAIFVLSVIVGIWQFAQTPVKVSAPGLEPCVVCQVPAKQSPAGI
jgi:hypothetical protein